MIKVYRVIKVILETRETKAILETKAIKEILVLQEEELLLLLNSTQSIPINQQLLQVDGVIALAIYKLNGLLVSISGQEV